MTTIEDGAAGYADGVLWCWVTGFTMAQAAGIFLDPAKTARIRYQYGMMEDVYEGFTTCFSLMLNNDGKISAGLKGGTRIV